MEFKHTFPWDFFSLAIFATLLGLYSKGVEGRLIQNCTDVCITESCIATASSFSSRMDRTVDPCEDFYDYTCGNTPGNSYILNDYEITHIIYDLQAKMKLKILSLFEEVNSDISLKRKNLLQSCKKFVAQSTNIKLEPIQRWLQNLGIPDWPHLDNSFNLSREDMNQLLVAFTSVEENPIFMLHPLTKPKVTYPPEFLKYLKEKKIMDFEYVPSVGSFKFSPSVDTISYLLRHENVTVQVLEYFGLPEEIAAMLSEDMLEVARELSKIADSGNIASKLDCSTAGNQSQIRWCEILQDLAMLLNPNFTLSDIQMYNELYFNTVDALLNSYPHKKIANYLTTALLLQIMESVQPLLRIEQELMETKLKFSDPTPPLYQRGITDACIDWILETCHRLLVVDYIDKYRIDEFVEMISEILDFLNKSYFSFLKNISWITEDVKKVQKKTVFNTELYVEYYKNHFNAEELQKLEISENDFLTNFLQLKKFQFEYPIRNVLHMSIQKFFMESLFKTNAQGGVGRIQFFFGFLQKHFLDSDRPWYLNFGGIGSIVGHELVHPFEELNFPDETPQEHLNFLDCLIEQYNKLEIPAFNIKDRGNQTAEENKSDLLGLQISYNAYLNYIDEHGDEPFLPGLNFTNQQMFFIAYAQSKWSLTKLARIFRSVSVSYRKSNES